MEKNYNPKENYNSNANKRILEHHGFNEKIEHAVT